MDKQGQKHFFEDIIEQHKGILFKVARVYCPNADDRQDLIQEMMIQIWQSIQKYNDEYKMSTWLYRISLNVAISYYRRSSTCTKQHILINEQVPEIKEEEQSENEHQLNLLEQFITELKEIDRALMILYLEDKSHAEIATVLGLSISNIGTKIGRIKHKLKARFSQLNS